VRRTRRRPRGGGSRPTPPPARTARTGSARPRPCPDDFAMRRLGAAEADDRCELVSERQGRSLIITSGCQRLTPAAPGRHECPCAAGVCLWRRGRPGDGPGPPRTLPGARVPVRR
jgi:hypothetical protein